MALFIGGLALDGPLLDSAKVGILMGSATSAVIGIAVLATVLRRGGPAKEID
jgi:NhaA family Na+:H+ antiporter